MEDEAKYNIDELVDDLKRAVRLEFSQEECLNVVLDSVVNVSKTSIEGTTEVVIDEVFLTLLGHKSKQIVAKTAKAIAEIAKTDRGRKKCTTIELIRALIDLLGCVQIPHPMVKTLENSIVRVIYAKVFGWLGSTQVGSTRVGILNAPLEEEDIEILTQACRALGNICHKNENGKNLVREQDGLKVILTVLKKGIALRNVEGANALRIEATQFLYNFLDGQKALCMKALEEDMLPILCEILHLHLYGLTFKDESHNVAAENVYITLNILTNENIIFLNQRLAIVLICIMRFRQPSYHDLSFDELTMRCLHIISGQAKDEKVKLLLAEVRAVEWLLHLWQKFSPQYNDEGMRSKLNCVEYLLCSMTTDDCFSSLKHYEQVNMMEWLKLRIQLIIKKIGREHFALTVGTEVIIYKFEMAADGRLNFFRIGSMMEILGCNM